MSDFLGDLGLGWLTLLPLPILALVLMCGGVGVGGVAVVGVGGFMACCGGVVAFMAVDQATGYNASVAVSGHTWERRIAVEKVVAYKDDDWCDDIPDDARVIERESRFHHREKRIGPDRDIYQEYCWYEALKWKTVDHVEKRGSATQPPPSWPRVADDGCAREGCTRPGTRSEDLHVLFEAQKNHKGDPWKCEMDDETEWTGWAQGDGATLLIGGITGSPHCGYLERKSGGAKPSPAPEPRPKKRRRER